MVPWVWEHTSYANSQRAGEVGKLGKIGNVGKLGKMGKIGSNSYGAYCMGGEEMPEREDGLLTELGLVETYGYWGYHSTYTLSDWVTKVESGDTRRGYWDWVASMIRGETVDIPR